MNIFHIFLIIGIFTGNLFYHGIAHKDWLKGFWVGLIAAVLCSILSVIYLASFKGV